MLKLFCLALVAAVAAAVTLGAGQALADHVQCGDVITRDTRLDSDLIDCPNHGVVIDADHVTLDLAGHTIDGDGDQWGVGVTSTNHLGIRVEDGTIQEFEDGIHILTQGNRVRYGTRGTDWPQRTNGYLGHHVIRRLEVRNNCAVTESTWKARAATGSRTTGSIPNARESLSTASGRRSPAAARSEGTVCHKTESASRPRYMTAR